MSSKYTLTPHTLLATQDIQQNIHYISVIAAIFEIVGISFSYRAFIRVKNNDEGNLLKAKYRHVPITRFSEYDKSELIYDSIATVGESRVWWRADFQSDSRVLKKVF